MSKRLKSAGHKPHHPLFLKVAGALWLTVLNTALVILPGYLIAASVAARLGKAGSLWVHLGVCLCWSFAVLSLMIAAMNHIRGRVGSNRSHHRPGIIYEVMDALDRIAGGDYNIHVKASDPWSTDHYGELVDKINALARDLCSMEQMRQEFVSNVSHEIQSPLTSISGFAALLKEDPPKEQRMRYAEVIEAESKRLSRLSDNLLRLSMLGGDEAVLKPRPFRLDRQMQEILLMLEPQWTEKGIELDLELDSVSCTADPELLSQVWINLLHNSIKCTPARGCISVSVKERCGEIVCTLSDTGCGIPAESLPRIFERFYKVDKARDRSKGGSGLGLSLVQKIVELHGGGISVRSTVGQGSAFTVTLPAAGPGGQVESTD